MTGHDEGKRRVTARGLWHALAFQHTELGKPGVGDVTLCSLRVTGRLPGGWTPAWARRRAIRPALAGAGWWRVPDDETLLYLLGASSGEEVMARLRAT